MEIPATKMVLGRKKRWILVATLVALGAAAAVVAIPTWNRQQVRERAADGVFLVKPYLQWGSGPRPDAPGAVEVLWQGVDREERWTLEVSTLASSDSQGGWVAAGPAVSRRVEVEGVKPRRLYRAAVGFPGGTASGSGFRYRVTHSGVPVFEARGRIPWIEPHPHRFVVFGDGGADTTAQCEVAYQADRARPDFVLITGDLTYYKGSLTEYLHHFFPIYNSDRSSPGTGAPLLRQTLVLAAAGNHDLIERDLDRCPDGLAFYLLWSLPLNGPIGTPGAANTPTLKGDPFHQRAFLEAAGPAYPQMANYAFDYGGAHWTVLDTNAYADWTDPAIRDWVVRELTSEAARKADWRFVAFHQPPFHSAREHAEEQRTRVLAELFEKAGVDIVFCGHIHHYERTYPLRFAAERTADGESIAVSADGRVAGRWTLDRAYDGVTQTCPDGVIYVVSGAGGARLYSRERHASPTTWQEFTARFISNTHSLTVVDVAAEQLTLRQVSSTGEELDRFVVTRRAAPAASGAGAARAP
jgi:3',5'-cyclic AMP phosphodiesterase CpdA